MLCHYKGKPKSVREYGSHAAARPRTQCVSEKLAWLVSPIQARLALAADQRSLSHLAFGNYAAANACGCGDSLLRAISCAIPGCSGAGCGAAGRSAAAVVGARLLQPCAQPAARGAGNRCEAWGSFSAR